MSYDHMQSHVLVAIYLLTLLTLPSINYTLVMVTAGLLLLAS